MVKVCLLLIVLLSLSLRVCAESETINVDFELKEHTLEREGTSLHYWITDP